MSWFRKALAIFEEVSFILAIVCLLFSCYYAIVTHNESFAVKFYLFAIFMLLFATYCKIAKLEQREEEK